MKKTLANFSQEVLSREQMKSVNGGKMQQFSCTASNGVSYSGYGDASDVKTFTLIYCGPCNADCTYY